MRYWYITQSGNGAQSYVDTFTRSVQKREDALLILCRSPVKKRQDA